MAAKKKPAKKSVTKKAVKKAPAVKAADTEQCEDRTHRGPRGGSRGGCGRGGI